jgi:rubredoxin
MSGVYAAQEELSDFLDTWDKQELADVQDACCTAASAIQEIAQEYADAAEAMQGAGEAMQEKAYNLESWASEIEDAGNQPDEFAAEYEEEIDCPECMSSEERAENAGSGTAKHQGEGKYECSVCNHTFTEEPKNADGQTRDEWADDVLSTVRDVCDNCPE